MARLVEYPTVFDQVGFFCNRTRMPRLVGSKRHRWGGGKSQTDAEDVNYSVCRPKSPPTPPGAGGAAEREAEGG